MTYDLAIAAPRSDRWYELEESAWLRTDGATDYGERRRLASTHTLAGRCLALLQESGELTTREAAEALSVRRSSAYVALILLSEEGEACREVRCRSASGHLRHVWRAR